MSFGSSLYYNECKYVIAKASESRISRTALCVKLPVHAPKGSQVNKSASEVYKTILFPNLCVNTNNLRYVSLKSEQL